MASRTSHLRADALAIFKAGLAAANAAEAVQRHVKVLRSHLHAGNESLSLRDFDRIFVVGAGKAGAAMTTALERALGADRISGGLVNVKHGHAKPKPKRVILRECGHPVPDDAGAEGARDMETLLRSLNARDLLFVLISGGASALLPAPALGLTLSDKQKTTSLLLKCGADIFELNTVRKHLSALKGGQLARLAWPATAVSLILSDVIGDPLDVIGSGPTAPDQTTFGDALRVLSKYELTRKVPRSVMARLEEGATGRIPETPKAGDPVFENVHNVIVGSNRLALEASVRKAKQLGYKTAILSTSIQGETREAARVHAEILREVLRTGNPVAPPACLLSGGETTVSVRGNGKGGRNQEFALASAMSLSGESGWTILCAGTDGTDGPTDAAGAIVDGSTAKRAAQKGFVLSEQLTDNDSYPVFQALGDLVKTGATGTNVMDMCVMLAGKK